MPRVPLSLTGGFVPLLVTATLLLPGCPLKDDYHIAQDEPGGAQSSGGMAAAGGAFISLSGRAGASAESGTGGASTGPGTGGAIDGTGGVSGESNRAGAGGDTGTATGGCVSLMNQGHAYAFCVSPLTQAEARTNCVDRGMTLAVIEDAAESAWIAEIFSKQYQGDTPRAFIGANDTATEGEWHWADGTIFWRKGAAVSGRYTNWSEEEPNDSSPFDGAPDCLSIYFSNGTWADVSCEAELPYVCEPR